MIDPSDSPDRTPQSSIAVVVVSYHDDEQVIKFIEQLRLLRTKFRQVVVVRNECTRDAPALATHLKDAVGELLELRNEENLGFAKAFNQGLSACDADIVLSMNSDVLPDEVTLGALVKRLDEDHSLLAVAPTLYNADGEEPGRRFYTFVRLLRSRAPWRLGNRHMPGPRDPLWALGACLGMRRKWWHALGGLDERYFLYFEDVDLCWRVWQEGGRVEVLSERLFHAHGKASRRWGKPLIWHVRSAVHFFAKNPRALVARWHPRGPLSD